ncbi:hypothetical protein ACFSE1_16260 [Rhizobium helianthi]|uniref:ASCH domain-containing protein n=1 Tax=Rhizobium helianthi TaxID=1132695 RepID=A0ABW4M989_9HYPH
MDARLQVEWRAAFLLEGKRQNQRTRLRWRNKMEWLGGSGGEKDLELGLVAQTAPVQVDHRGRQDSGFHTILAVTEPLYRAIEDALKHVQFVRHQNAFFCRKVHEHWYTPLAPSDVPISVADIILLHVPK